MRDQYQKQIEKEVASYRKAYDKVMNSDDPRLAGQDVKDYEVGKLREQLEANVSQIEAEFTEKIEAEIERAAKEAGRSRFFVSSPDKQYVTDITDNLVTKLTFAVTDADKSEAFSEYDAKLELIEDVAPFSEVVKQLAEASRKLGDDEFSKKKIRGLYYQLNEGLRTPEQERYEALKVDKMTGVSHKFRTLQMTHPSYSHKQAARKSKRM
ncbi:hypothetical protein [Rossellomorea sp. LjRoot5]|uniref:hypothetical protein n=1 Tax=Rossellomorea sp. LjRoot5 TaxID=3342331 RepID=UPI003ED10013